MPLVTKLVLTFFNYLPWVAVTLAAALAHRRKRDSIALLLQAVSAAILFLLALARWLVVDLLLQTVIKPDAQIMNAAHNIFGFLLFMALAAFALGYCIERFARNKTAQAATPRA